MSVSSVSNTNSVSNAAASQNSAALDTYNQLVSYLEDNQEKLEQDLIKALKKELDELKNLINANEDEKLIEELMAALVSKIEGNTETGAVSLAQRSQALSDLEGLMSGLDSTMANKLGFVYSSLANAINVNGVLTSTQLNALSQVLSLANTLESVAQQDSDGFLTSLLSALRENLDTLVTDAGANQNNFQASLDKLTQMINGDASSIGLSDRLSYLNSILKDLDTSSSEISQLVQSYRNSFNKNAAITGDQAKTLASNLENAISSIILAENQSSLTDAGIRREQQSASASIKKVLASNEFRELTLETKAAEDLYNKQESNTMLKRLREQGIMGGSSLSRAEIIAQEERQLEQKQAERLNEIDRGERYI